MLMRGKLIQQDLVEYLAAAGAAATEHELPDNNHSHQTHGREDDIHPELSRFDSARFMCSNRPPRETRERFGPRHRDVKGPAERHFVSNSRIEVSESLLPMSHSIVMLTSFRQ